MATLRKTRARKPIIENGRFTMVASAEGAKGYTLWTNDDGGADYGLDLTEEEALRFAHFVLEMTHRRVKNAT